MFPAQAADLDEIDERVYLALDAVKADKAVKLLHEFLKRFFLRLFFRLFFVFGLFAFPVRSLFLFFRHAAVRLLRAACPLLCAGGMPACRAGHEKRAAGRPHIR